MNFNELEESYKARNFFRLTQQQWQIFCLLVFREQASYNAITQQIWPDPDNEPNNASGTIKVQTLNLRKKLRNSGIIIGTAWGEGYYMTLENRKKAIELAQKAMEN
jgi:DNA-binding response OmpR family regulator